MPRHFKLSATLLLLVGYLITPATADETTEARQVIDEAVIASERVRDEQKSAPTLENLLKRAQGVFIIPSFYKAGFILSAAYGDGVLLRRNGAGQFGDPAFYRMTAGGIGLQIGMQSSEIMFLIMTQEGIDAFMEDEFKIGANVGIAVGPVGAGAEAANSTDLGEPIYAYSVADGLFAGFALDGAVISPRADLNAAIYGVNNNDPARIVNGNTLQYASRLKSTLASDLFAAAPTLN